MGIKGLNKIIKQLAPDATTCEHVSVFRGTKVAIDSEILVHKFMSSENTNAHIFGFLTNVLWYLRNGIMPVYVFDGHPVLHKKKNAISRRMHTKDQISKKIDDLEDLIVEHPMFVTAESFAGNNPYPDDLNDLFSKLSRFQKKMSKIRVTRQSRNECKYLLKLMGVPYINAPNDAEAMCVVLQRRGLVDFVYSEDTDVIPYYLASESIESRPKNNPRFFKSTNCSKNFYYSNDGYDMISVVNVDIIKEKLQLTSESMVDLCILSGCDFASPFTGPASETPVSLIRKHETIENVMAHYPRDFDFKTPRDVFYGASLMCPHVGAFGLTKMDVQGLRRYLSLERNINSFLINSIVVKFSRTVESFESGSGPVSATQ